MRIKIITGFKIFCICLLLFIAFTKSAWAQESPITIPALRDELLDNDVNKRRDAVYQLGEQRAIVAVPDLARMFRDPDPEVRRRTAAALGKIGPDARAAVPALRNALLGDKDTSVRLAVAWALGHIGPEARTAVPDLITMLGEPTPASRLAAIDALAGIGPDANAAIPNLVGLLLNSDLEVRRMVTWALGKVGLRREAAVDALVRGLGDPNAEVRKPAAWALGQVGSTGNPSTDLAKINALIRVIRNDPEVDVRGSAALALATIGSEARNVVSELSEALRKEHEVKVLQPIALCLGKIGRDAKTAVPALTELLHHSDADLQKVVAWALGEIKSTTEVAVAALVRQLESRDARVRRDAASALGHIGRENKAVVAKEAVPALGKALQDTDVEVIQAAAGALANFGSEARTVVPVLIVALSNSVAGIREAAAGTLAAIGPEAKDAVPALSGVLQQDSNARVCQAAAWALGSVGPAALDAVPILINALPSNNEGIRRTVAWALGSIGPVASYAAPDLIERIPTEPSAGVRQASLWALGQIMSKGNKVGVQALAVQMLDKDPAPEVRRVAADILARLKPSAKDVVSTLSQTLLRDTDVEVRRITASVIGPIGSPAIDAVPALSQILLRDTEDVEVRRTAAWALGKIHTPGEMGSSAKTIIDALSRALMVDPAVRVRYESAEALCQIGPQAKDAIPALAKVLQNDRSPGEIRQVAAKTLGCMGSEAKSVMPVLIGALQDKNTIVRLEVIKALIPIGAEAGAIPDLIKKLEDPDSETRQAAANALATVGPDAKGAVPVLIKMSKSTNPKDRLAAIGCLGYIGPEAKAAVPVVTEALRQDPDKNIRQTAAQTLEQIGLETDNDTIDTLCKALKDEDKDVIIQVNKALKTVSSHYTSPDLYCQNLRWVNLGGLIKKLLPIILLVLWYTICLIIFWINPLWMLKINEVLKPFTFKIDKWGIDFNLSYLLLVGLLAYCPRVLDAWVKVHISKALENFESILLKEKWDAHMSIPVEFNGKNIPRLTVEEYAQCFCENLRPIFHKNIVHILIWGKTGLGKTRVAYQIAKWALTTGNPHIQLCEYSMLPVIIKNKFGTSLVESISKQLQEFTDEAKSVPQELLQNLLRSKRVLVILDHLSEMDRETRNTILHESEQPDFPVNALIVTSLHEETLVKVWQAVIKPL